MRKPSMVHFTPARSIPFYFEMYGFEWPSEYVRYLDGKKQIPALQQEQKRIEAQMPDKADFLRRLKKGHSELLKRGAENLKGYLRGQYRHPNPLNFYNLRLGAGDNFSPLHVPTWQDLEAAAAQINFDGTITEKDRAKSLSVIENKLADLEKELVKLCPKKYCEWMDGIVRVDKRKRLVDYWRNLQMQVNAPVNPTGMKLEISPEKEQKAWQELGFEKLVYSMARFQPHTGVGVRESDLIPMPIEDTSRPIKEKIPLRQGQAKGGHKVLSPGLAL